MTEKGGGISKTIFISGIILALVASSIISYVLVTQLTSVEGLKGEQGDTGPTGPMGPQGLQGEQGLIGPAGLAGGITEIPISSFSRWSDSFTTSSTQWTDIIVSNNPVSTQITVESDSTLLLTFNSYLRGTWLSTTSGWTRLEIRALIDNVPATPETVYALEVPSGQSGSDASSHNSHSSSFLGNVSAGTHTIRIQCQLLGLTEAVILYPSLIVQAFPN